MIYTANIKLNKTIYNRKYNIINTIFIILFSFIIIYFSYLQIYKHKSFITQVNLNCIKQTKIPAPRGNITDRNGILLATTIYKNNLYITPHNYDLKSICNNSTINCLDIFSSIKRKYIAGTATSHIIGYLGRIDRNTLEVDNPDALFADDDLIGQSGIEYIYNRELHGINGYEKYIVMANGVELSSPNRFIAKNEEFTSPIIGNSITLSIDDRIQVLFAKEIGNRQGAAVMIKPSTGAIIAMYSSPSFDPNNIYSSFKDINYPLMNRALIPYAPGSTFKIITVLAALELGVINTHTIFDCPGYYRYGGRVFHCWKHHGHGKIDMREAIKGSCDVYFYQLALKVGLQSINKYAHMLGLGEYTSIDLNNDAQGHIPLYKKYNGDVLNTAIGQGSVQVSPLQLADAYAAIINSGILYAPKIVLNNSDERILLKNNSFKKENIKFIMNALYAVVNEEGGTAYHVRLQQLGIAGKTGTAQIAGLDKKKKENAWFVGYWPSDMPKIIVSIFVEGAGHGSSVAPIAFKAIELYSSIN